jgi:uncharacterized membrane protein YgcG
MKIFINLICACTLLAAIPALALDVPAHPAGRINDLGGMFSPPLTAQLNQYLGNYAAKSGTQIVIATFPSLEGGNLNDFVPGLAAKWELEKTSKSNWILVVIFKDDRLIRIEVGPGLREKLTIAECSTIIHQVVGPRFKTKDYDNGIKEAILVMINILEDNITFRPIEHKQWPRPVKIILALSVIAAGIILTVAYRKRADRAYIIGSQGEGYGQEVQTGEQSTPANGLKGGW